jgi:hypothetical protein
MVEEWLRSKAVHQTAPALSPPPPAAGSRRCGIIASRLICVRRSAFSDMDARGEMDRTMVTAGYVVLLTVLVAAVGWGLWQLLAKFNREIDE